MRLTPIVLIFLFGLSSCESSEPTERSRQNTGQVRQSGLHQAGPVEYLVTLDAGANPEDIRRAFSSREILEVSQVSGSLYLVKFKRDPGLEKLEELASREKKIIKVQPNHQYSVP